MSNNVDIEKLLDDAESDAKSGFTPVDAGKYKLRAISGKTKVIEQNGVRNLGIALAPVATETGESVNGEMIYHKLPLEGEFEKRNKDGSTTTTSKAVFFMNFFLKGLGLSRDDTKAIYESVNETATGEHATLKLADGSYFSIEGKEVMGTVAVTNSKGKDYRNIKGVWAISAE